MVIKKRWIKVGGGYITSEEMGTAVLQDKSGKEILLQALYVPKLGVNLVSGRKLCYDFNLYGFISPASIVIMDGEWRPVLETKVQGGVYVITKILRAPEKTKSDHIPSYSKDY